MISIQSALKISTAVADSGYAARTVNSASVDIKTLLRNLKQADLQ